MYSTWLKWPVKKRHFAEIKLAFVEAATLGDPGTPVVDAVLRLILGSQPGELVPNPFDNEQPRTRPTPPYDLLLFPEALLNVCELPTLIAQAPSYNKHLGAVHIGLRSDRPDEHLLSTEEVGILLAALEGLTDVEIDDLACFRKWFSAQDGGMWNLAAFFARDRNDKIRICLHAKIVQSKYEAGVSDIGTMSESDTTWVVSFIPQEVEAAALHVQPVICADLTSDLALKLVRSSLSKGGESFGLVGSIDLVSAPVATPAGTTRWRDQFLEVLTGVVRSAATGHRHATFALANYALLPFSSKKVPGGLSGVFVPAHAGQACDGFTRQGYLRPPHKHRSALKVDPDTDLHWLDLDKLDGDATFGKEHSVWPAVGTLVMLSRPPDEQPHAMVRLAHMQIQCAPRFKPFADRPIVFAGLATDVRLEERQ